ncbi:MAG: XRE family transcriptional regulator [Sphingobacteriaceae bacterium]|nr:XRE family transcriptional regulator [Sphingobacteriaceae bacterium]
MQDTVLVQISNRIKELRKEKNTTVQDLAEKAQVSKGLISQIENSRTIPSLSVLINIIQALDVDLNMFFKNMQQPSEPLILVKRAKDYTSFEKENSKGFSYQRIFSRAIKNATIDFVILDIEANAHRPMVKTQAYEYKYIIEGSIDYIFKDERISLHAGDSMLFDGRIPHSPHNNYNNNCKILVIYFFEET